MITTATNQMVPELKELWKLCFHDEDTYIDFYYRNRFVEKETLVYLVESHVVAMLTLMPGYVVHHKEKQPVRYVYAVATHPDHRKRGYAAALIDYAHQFIPTDYVGTFLVPASPSLFQYYETLGYQAVSNKELLHCKVDDFLSLSKIEELEPQVRMEQLTEYDYDQYRAKAYENTGYVMWEIDSLRYLISEFQFLGGYAYKVIMNREEGALLYYLDRDTLVIKETTLSDSGIREAVRFLKLQMSFSYITIILPKTSHLVGETMPYAMSYANGFWGNEYINMALD